MTALLSVTAAMVLVGLHPTPANSAPEPLIENVVASTNVEWSEAFGAMGSRYRAPRVMLLRHPTGHPARGAGFSPNIGIVIDRGDVEAIEKRFGPDARTLVALLVAHEVGHHVQSLVPDEVITSGRVYEAQADCLSGWWFTAANRRAAADGDVLFSMIDLDVRVPQLLTLLNDFQSGLDTDLIGSSASHGLGSDRVVAFRQGMSAATPWACLWGSNP